MPDREKIDIIDAEVGTWPEYRRYVVNQLRDTSVAIGSLKDAISEQRIKMASLDAHLSSVLDGTIIKRLESLENAVAWAKGIGAVVALLWSLFLIFITKMLK